MLRLTVRALAAGGLCLLVTASHRDPLQAAGQIRRDGPTVAAAGQLVISEFRLRGPGGAQDEFIEIYNRSGSDHTVAALSGTAYGIAASDGVTRCSIPNGTIIPNRGHFLCVNSAGYSLASYPAGNGTLATGDATYTLDIPDNAGIAIFNNNSEGGSYSLANRLDAVGSTTEANTVYREGGGYPALTTPLDINGSFTRRVAGGCTGSAGGGNCNSILLMQTTSVPTTTLSDVNNNVADFLFVDTNGNNTAAGQRLGAPGPENLSSPINRGISYGFAPARLETCAPTLAPPNKVRDFTSDPGNNSTFGTYDIRRTWTNNTGLSLTRLRFRIVGREHVSLHRGRRRSPAAHVGRRLDWSEQSAVRWLFVGRDGPRDDARAAAVTAEWQRLQRYAVGRRGDRGSPLGNGTSISVRFLLGIQQVGIGRFCVIAETLPATASDPSASSGRPTTTSRRRPATTISMGGVSPAVQRARWGLQRLEIQRRRVLGIDGGRVLRPSRIYRRARRL